jgi:hypothetical protein
MRMFVHDEVIFEIPTPLVEEVKLVAEEVMTDLNTYAVPILVDGTSAPVRGAPSTRRNMPYIKQEERGNMVQLLNIPTTPGQLNYLLTSLCLAYIREQPGSTASPRRSSPTAYQRGDRCVLECAKPSSTGKQAAPTRTTRPERTGTCRGSHSRA